MPENAWHSIVFDVDQVAETATVTVDGIEYVIPFAASSSGLFQTGQKIGLLGTVAGGFTLPQGVRAADMSVEINGAPHKTISNDAAIANADAWHLGGNLLASP